MSLIEELQQTPRWREFENWYYTQMVDNNYIAPVDVWLYPEDSDTSFQTGAFGLPFEFLKGVFEKFIVDTSPCTFEVFGTLGDERYYRYIGYDDHDKYTFGELLIWYFNQES